MTSLNILAFDNVDVLYSDFETQFEFYHRTLGLPLLFELEEGGDWFAVRAANVDMYFFPGKGNHPGPLDSDSYQNPPGLESVSFSVESLDDAIAFLDDKVTWTSDIETWSHPNGTHYRFRFFNDPEGNKLSLTQPHKVS